MVNERQDVRPIPDPTLLTTEQLRRETGTLRDALMTEIIGGRTALRAEIQGDKRVFETRLAGMDEAIKLLQALRDKMPMEIDAKLLSLQALIQKEFAIHDERFASVALQFKERDTRSERESRDNKVAVDAAFAAQKEAAAKQDEANSKAIDKSEKATTETINKLTELNRTEIKGLSGTMDDLKDRVTRAETNATAAATAAAKAEAVAAAASTDRRGDRGQSISIVSIAIGSAIAIAGLLIGLFLK